MRGSKARHSLRCLITGLAMALLCSGGQAFAQQRTADREASSLNQPRFTVLSEFNGEAVRDNKTGLIWEKAPRLEMYEWSGAQQRCRSTDTGGGSDWRVPTREELRSLVDPASTDLKLPSGHPFLNVEPALYWSATAPEANGNYAAFVNFSSGGSATLEKYMSSFVWCVRGPIDR